MQCLFFKQGLDRVKENAIKYVVGEYISTSTYDSREIATSYAHSPAVLCVLETKALSIQTSLGVQTFQKGATVTSISATIAAWFGIVLSAAMNYVVGVLGIVGSIDVPLEVEGYDVYVDYYRTGGYKNKNDRYYTLCPNIKEEYSVHFAVVVSPSKATGTDYLEVTSVVDGPNESYLNSERTFDTAYILERAYKEYLSMT